MKIEGHNRGKYHRQAGGHREGGETAQQAALPERGQRDQRVLVDGQVVLAAVVAPKIPAEPMRKGGIDARHRLAETDEFFIGKYSIEFESIDVTVQEPLPDVEVDETYRQRPAYQEGHLTDQPDLSIYDDPVPDDDPGQQESEDDDE